MSRRGTRDEPSRFASNNEPKPGPANPTEIMRDSIAAIIRSIPRGKVSTYGAVARAAGYSGAARQVAAVLRRSAGMPWQRVLGSGGEIKLTGDSAIEQRLRLEAEGVSFRGKRANMRQHGFKLPATKQAAQRRVS